MANCCLSRGRLSWSYLGWKTRGLRHRLAFVLIRTLPPLTSKLSGPTAPETKKVTYELSTYLDILHRIFRETLFPRVGNHDMVHSYLVDMLLFCQHQLER